MTAIVTLAGAVLDWLDTLELETAVSFTRGYVPRYLPETTTDPAGYVLAVGSTQRPTTRGGQLAKDTDITVSIVAKVTAEADENLETLDALAAIAQTIADGAAGQRFEGAVVTEIETQLFDREILDALNLFVSTVTLSLRSFS